MCPASCKVIVQDISACTRTQGSKQHALSYSSSGSARYSLNIAHWLGCWLLGFRCCQRAATAAPEGGEKVQVSQPVLQML